MPASIRIPMRLSLAFVSIALFVQCAGFFQSTGRMLVSDSDEAKLGLEFHKSLASNDTAKQEFPLFVPKNQAQSDLQAYILGLANEVIAAIPAKDKPAYGFTVTLIDKDVENAFAVPGGYVYIYTGILKRMRDESELMGVLGHEVTHVSHHHYREQVAKSTTLGLALQTALVVSGSGQGGQLAAGAVSQLAGLKFSRSDETDADKSGTKMTGATGRNPLGIAKYFSRAQSAGAPEWLSTHPGNKNRVKTVTQQVKGDPALSGLAADSATTDYRDRFQKHIGAL